MSPHRVILAPLGFGLPEVICLFILCYKCGTQQRPVSASVREPSTVVCLISLCGGDGIRVLSKSPLIRVFLSTWVRWRPVRGRTYF
ncbi:hypothetical protein T492DRAFT_994013 [Pavlovales sp. CCMP2436]|nr:hypothetical protein T492DRAFT_994013 [Pavlovales sp. CCMP2436]